MRVLRTDGSLAPVEVDAEGTPLYTVLERAGVERFDLTFLDVRTEGEARLRLTRAEAFRRADPAILTETEVRYGGRRIRADRIVLALGQGSALTVTATASPTRVEVGEAVTFTATVGGLDDGETPRVRWTFADESPRGEGARVVHRFDRPGTYTVLAGATTPDDPAGQTATVTVAVGRAVATPTPTATPTATPAPGFTAGGGAVGGAAPGVSPPADSGPAASPADPTPTPVASPTPAPTRPFGRRIAGELLDTSALVAAPAAPAPAAPAAPDETAEAGGFSLSPGAVGTLVLAGLLWLGFSLDMRRARTRWT